jgi:hypothetical protein
MTKPYLRAPSSHDTTQMRVFACPKKNPTFSEWAMPLDPGDTRFYSVAPPTAAVAEICSAISSRRRSIASTSFADVSE